MNPLNSQPRKTGRARVAQRRGSFIVVVVGTLALIALIGVIYFTLGMADRQASAALTRQQRLQEPAARMAQHVGQTIAEDLFATTSAQELGPQAGATGGGNLVVRRRAAWDYAGGGGDWTASATQRDRSAPDFFSPIAGGHDWWLASTEPTRLAYPPAPPATAQPYVNYKDWAQISNLAPDGRFVNLFNIRGNFDAEPGFNQDAGGKERTSERLSFLTEAGQIAAAPDFGSSLFQKDRPAYWSNRQRGAFRPVGFDHSTRPNNPNYLPYQWADADGDGFYDSRWFEMKDARDFDGDGQPDGKDLLGVDDPMRYFFAARVIDLSGLVNVNTATDFLAAPDAQYPAGLTPADVDLRRLLLMQDSADLYDRDSASWGYSTYKNPGSGSKEDYSNYDFIAAASIGASGYDALRKSFEDARVPDRGAIGAVPPLDSSQKRFEFFSKKAVLTGRAGHDGTAILTFPGAGGPEDTAELLTRRGVNNPGVLSRLEAVLGGRILTDLSPLRENRSLAFELDGRADTSGAVTTQAMLWSATDLRQRLTTISGARPLRPVTFRTGTTSGVEVRTEPDLKLSVDQVFGGSTPQSTQLFSVYANALLPYSDLAGAWPTGMPGGESQDQKYRTLFYGYRSPELPLIMSAQMAVNMADAYDANAEPIARTVLVDRELRTKLEDTTETSPTFGQPVGQVRDPVDAEVDLFPWWGAGKFDLDPSVTTDEGRRLASSSSEKVIAPAVTVYGIEPQPVLTQVGSFTVYTDLPFAQGGDNDHRITGTDPGGPSGPSGPTGPGSQPTPPDGQPKLPGGLRDPRGSRGGGGGGGPAGAASPRPLGGPAPLVDPQITINGTISEGNGDFLFRIVTFQLHNPFDVAIDLSLSPAPDGKLDTELAFYYIQLGDQTYKLCQLNDETSTVQPLRLEPHQTIMCYAGSEQLKDMVARAQRADGAITRGMIEAWLSGQLGIDSAAMKNQKLVQIPRVILEGGSDDGKVAVGFHPLLTDADADQVATLWRTVRVNLRKSSPGDPPGPDDGPWGYPTGFNEKPRDAGGFYIPTRNKPQNDQLVDRFRAFDPADTQKRLARQLTEGNNRIPGTRAGIEPDGPLAHDNTGWTIALWTSFRRPADPSGGTIPLGALPAYMIEPKEAGAWNAYKPDGFGTSRVVDFEGSMMDGPGSHRRAGELFIDAGPWSPDMATSPDAQTTEVIASTKDGKAFAEVRRELFLPNNELKSGGRSYLRVTDMLLPMAVGPCEIPWKSDGGGIETDRDIRYTTLSESLALAFNYENSPKGLTPLYQPLTQLPPGRTFRPVTDRGNLVLDDFAPFLDDNGDKLYQADGSEEILEPGIPPALTILDAFTPFERALASAYRPIPGLVNVNTASLPVLRTLPLLSPPPASDKAGQPLWWGAGGYELDSRSDIAATLAAYRDKLPVEKRTIPAATPPEVVDYVDYDSAGGAAVPPDRASPPLQGRRLATGFDAIRERPGLRSLGEIMCAIERDTSGNRTRGSIDFAGSISPAINISRPGIDTALYPAAPGDPPSLQDDVAGEYDQKLAIAAALANTASIRSDVFACWFIVQGYQRSDVEGLSGTNETPLVPSFQKRYLMILDRSNVVRRGDKPRVVLMREVPL